MAIEVSEKNFLERLGAKIPGLKGYRAREERRDTDKRLREYLAGELDRARRSLLDAKLAMTKGGKLDALDKVDRSERRMQRLADAIRLASYGYSGVFDQLKIGEAELDRIYSHDNSIVGMVADVTAKAAAVPVDGDVGAALGALEEVVTSLDQKWQQRKTLFDTPTA